MLYYYLTLNIITFLFYGFDKRAAVKDHWRVSEKTLLGLAVLGGGFGALFGMTTFHHKTRKNYFWAICATATLLHAYIFFRVALSPG